MIEEIAAYIILRDGGSDGDILSHEAGGVDDALLERFESIEGDFLDLFTLDIEADVSFG